VCVACFVKQHRRRTVLGRGTAHACEDRCILWSACSNMMYRPLVDTLEAAIKGGLSMYLHILGFTSTKRYASVYDSSTVIKVSCGSNSTLNRGAIRSYTDVHYKPVGCSEGSRIDHTGKKYNGIVYFRK